MSAGFERPGMKRLQVNHLTYSCEVAAIHQDGPYAGQARDMGGKLVVVTDAYSDVSDAWAALLGKLGEVQP